MGKTFSNILKTIGDTPLMELSGVTGPDEGKIFAKCEFKNPGGSVKDRIALAMIEEAEKSGKIYK